MTTVKKFLKIYLFCCFIFGFHFDNIFIGSKKQCPRFLLYIPRTIHIIIIITSVISFGLNIIESPQVFLSQFLLITACFPNIVSILWAKSSENKIKYILQHLSDTEHQLKILFGAKVCFGKLQRVLRVKFFLSVIMISLIQALKMFVKSALFSTASDIFLYLLSFYKIWATFFALCLIEYNNFLLFSLNQHLEKMQCNFELYLNMCDQYHLRYEHQHLNESRDNSKLYILDQNVWGLIHLYRNIQRVHFKLHQTASAINSRFGYFLLAAFLDIFNYTVNNIFGLIVNLIDPKLGLTLFRNFIVQFFLL